MVALAAALLCVGYCLAARNMPTRSSVAPAPALPLSYGVCIFSFLHILLVSPPPLALLPHRYLLPSAPACSPCSPATMPCLHPQPPAPCHPLPLPPFPPPFPRPLPPLPSRHPHPPAHLILIGHRLERKCGHLDLIVRQQERIFTPRHAIRSIKRILLGQRWI